MILAERYGQAPFDGRAATAAQVMLAVAALTEQNMDAAEMSAPKLSRAELLALDARHQARAAAREATHG